MRNIALFLVFFLVNNLAEAKKITIVNKTNNTIQVMMIPHGVTGLSKHKKAKALKNRYKQLRPYERAKLKSDNIDGIDVKVLSKSMKSMTWHKYDDIRTRSLMQEINNNKNVAIKIYFKNEGDEYDAKIGGRTISGQTTQSSKIFKSFNNR